MENSTSLFSSKFLMNKDSRVGIIQGDHVTLLKGLEHLAPLCFSQSNWPMSLWADTRVIDPARVNSRLIKKISRIRQTDNLSTLYANHGVSITDSYWICDAQESISWDQVKPNSDKLFSLALTGQGFNSCDFEIQKHITPELTNVGSFDKAWKKSSNGWLFVKAGTPDQNLSEILVSRIGKLFGMDMLTYWPSDDKSCTVSKDFTKGIYCFEPMSYLVGDDEDYWHSYKILSRFSQAIAQKYLDILVLDAIVVNPDRHTNNYGLLRDHCGNICDLAPNYDNNLAFIATGLPEHLTTWMISDVVEFMKSYELAYTLKPVSYQDILHECQYVSQLFSQDPHILANLIWENYQVFIKKLH